jgi:DNA-binding beta-propeller fold protein YncE
MRKASLRRGWLAGLLFTSVLLGVTAPAAQGAPSDPLFVFTPMPVGLSSTQLPPPFGYLEDPCGLGVDPAGHFYVSDYYHDGVDAYDQNANYNAKGVTGATGYLGQLGGVDPVDGPCGLAFDAVGNLYLNDYHRAIKRYGALGSFGAGSTITGATTAEATHPTGVAVDPASGDVYVDQRTHVSVFDESGAPLIAGLPGSEVPLRIGAGTLKDGYGIALSSYPGTEGRLYVLDAATDTVKVYDPASPNAAPLEEIDGSETPGGRFVSLRDASVAVDRVTGEIYVVDDLQPKDTERPQAIIDVFHPDGTYEGHLKLLITWGMPSGLAVDNSATATQGRVYVTSGNSAPGSIYAYGPGAATTAAIALPALPPAPAGESGALSGEALGQGCLSCEKEAALSAGAAGAMQGPAPAALSAGDAMKRRATRHQRRKARHRKAHRTHTRGVARGG